MLSITQAELARRIGISASYLNLIERNRRGLSAPLLKKIADALELETEDLDGAAERRLHDLLSAVAEDPRLAALRPEREAVGELIGRYPGWASAIGALARSETESSELARALSDRLTHDPFLGEAVYGLATRTAAIRSTAEILETVPDIEAEQAARFHEILAEESRTLTDLAEALGTYFDKAATPARSVTPVDEVEAFFDRAENRFPAIEAAIAGIGAPVPPASAIVEAERHAGDIVASLITEAPEIETASARARARGALTRYAADAAAAPEESFARDAAAAGYDIDRLGAELDLPIDLICRRLTALAPARGRPRVGYISANMAGAVLELRSLPGFHPSRYGTLCPRWILFRAQEDPDRASVQRVVLPRGQGFLLVARARRLDAAAFGARRRFATDMIFIPWEDAEATVYASAAATTPAEEVGLGCRACPRRGCDDRVEDPFAAWNAPGAI